MTTSFEQVAKQFAAYLTGAKIQQSWRPENGDTHILCIGLNTSNSTLIKDTLETEMKAAGATIVSTAYRYAQTNGEGMPSLLHIETSSKDHEIVIAARTAINEAVRENRLSKIGLN